LRGFSSPTHPFLFYSLAAQCDPPPGNFYHQWSNSMDDHDTIQAAKALADSLGRPVFVVAPPRIENHPGILVEADKFQPRKYVNGSSSVITRIAYPRGWRYRRAAVARRDGVIGGMVGAQT
jgi:hypothetical protein